MLILVPDCLFVCFFCRRGQQPTGPSVTEDRIPHWCEPDDPLMESWDSLTKFNQCQRGQGSPTWGWRGDILTSLFSVSPVRHRLHPMPRPHRPSLILTTPRMTLVTPTEDLRDSRCSRRVATLVINILSTWGGPSTTSASTVSEIFSSNGGAGHTGPHHGRPTGYQYPAGLLGKTHASY